MSPPALVAVAHGSRNPGAGRCIRNLLRAVAARRPRIRVHAAFVELTPPGLTELLAALDGTAVVVPLLLGRGHHVGVDVPAAARERAETVVTPPLGPDPLLAQVLADRLRNRGGPRADAVVLGAAGSRDPAAAEDAQRMAGWLRAELGASVTVGYAAAARPSVAAVVTAARAAGARRVAVASYLLAPGHFDRLVRGCGADVVTAPMSSHPAVADVVLARYDAACSGGLPHGVVPAVR